MTHQTAQEIANIQQGLGETIRRARQRLGLSRLELAERMGYQKPQRGAAKIAAWEQGRAMPRGDRPQVLERALALADAALSVHVAAANTAQSLVDRDARQRQRWDRVAISGQLKTLRRQHRFLLAHLDAIRARPDWFGARIAGAGVGVAYLGGGPLLLGDLLELWDRGELTVPSDCCDDALRLYYVAGSPLSGRNSVAGFCGRCLREHYVRLTDDPPFVAIHPPALERLRARARTHAHARAPHQSLLILEDVVVALGAGDSLPSELIRDGQRRPIARWLPAEGILRWLGQGRAESGDVDAVARSPRLLPRDPYQHDHSLVVDSGHGDLEPFEIWQGNAYGSAHPTSSRRRWVAYPGHLIRPDGSIAARYAGVLPAAALAALVRHCRATSNPLDS